MFAVSHSILVYCYVVYCYDHDKENLTQVFDNRNEHVSNFLGVHIHLTAAHACFIAGVPFTVKWEQYFGYILALVST